MGFISISIDEYIKKHVRNNPSTNALDLKNQMMAALEARNKGVKCHCGNDIWVIGSAIVGHKCFTCITGESTPDGDYEINLVSSKKKLR
jgi:hypothetical protein